MRRFLKNLFRDLLTTRKTQPARQALRRANLQMEGLEDRMVLSTTSPIEVGAVGPNLEVFVTQPGIQVEFTADKNGQVDVVQLGGPKPILCGHASIASINNVDVNLVSNDSVTVDDSHGYPFANGTTIKVAGTGPGNSLTLQGSETFSGPQGNEVYLPGSPGFDATLFLGGVNMTGSPPGTKYNFDTTVSFTDSFKTTGTLDVHTSSGNESLSGSNGVTQKLSGLSVAGGAGNTLTYGNKSLVQLDLFEVGNSTVTLDATAAAAGEKSFTLELNNSAVNDVVFIDATPSTVTTNVTVNGTGSFVDLSATSGPVSIQGTGTPSVALGNARGTEAGIQANVTVNGARQLVVIDDGNNTTQENVTVTESTISGTGLFGNTAATLTYSNTPSVTIFTGQQLDRYTVNGTQGSGSFVGVNILDNSHVGLAVRVNLDAKSALDVNLNNTVISNPAPASTEVVAIGATIEHSRVNPVTGTLPLSGFDAAVFPGNARADDVTWENVSVNNIPPALPPLV